MVFVDWFSPGYKGGGPIQSCKNFVKAFKTEFEIYVVTSDRDLGENQPYPDLIINKWIAVEDKVSVFYATIKDLRFLTVRTLVREVEPDYIYLNSMFSYKLTIFPLLLKRFYNINVPLIIAPRGMLHAGALHFKAVKKKLFIRVFNALKFSQQLIFHATDLQEKKDINHFFTKAQKVFVAENFPAMDEVQWEKIPKEPGILRCIFLSRMSPKKNILYFLKILQGMPRATSITFSIYGEIEDPHYWLKCEEVIAQMPDWIKVTYEGPVNHQEIFRIYKQFHVFVLPTLGENFGHAIFEALLAGKPVLISDKTPWRNLSKKKIGYEISLDQPIAFNKAIINFTSWNQAEYDLWSQSAWSYANQYRTKSNTKAKYAEIFK
jgi:glycosyltransferase involved in cell wall biosynthesis